MSAVEPAFAEPELLTSGRARVVGHPDVDRNPFREISTGEPFQPRRYLVISVAIARSLNRTGALIGPRRDPTVIRRCILPHLCPERHTGI